jgi:hypothetical protein
MRNAFALPSERGLTDEERDWLAKVAREIVRRRLSAPAAFMIESLRPVQYLGSQAVVFLKPLLRIVVSEGQVERLASLLERPAALDELEAALERAEREGRS